MCKSIKDTLFFKILGKKPFKKKRDILVKQRDALLPDDPNDYLSPLDKRQLTFLTKQIDYLKEFL